MSTLALAACAVGLSGCYERVIRAEGPGANRYQVYEPTEQPAIDRAIDDFFSGGKKKKTPLD